MATLVAASPPPLNIDNVFAQGHAPPSPAYSSPPHPPSPLSPKHNDGSVMRATTSSLPSTSTSSSIQVSAAATQDDAPTTMFFQGDASASVRPAKDVAAFISLLPPPVEFVEGSSSGAFASSLEGRYDPINASPKAAPKVLNKFNATEKLSPAGNAALQQKATISLHPYPIELSWPPRSVTHGSGLYNIGNTCFLNSALQCLLHTPPLLRILLSHKGPECRVKNGFCMSCAMRQVMIESYERRRPFTPVQITRNMNYIAKHFKRGRQEDAHEFLRYAIDSLQKSCLAVYSPKIDHKIAETSWVHKIFGGRLRSRVTCHACGHNSDTFDSILDLSVDIYNMASLKEALRNFTAKDYLKGPDKYKCEKCKRAVNAEKQFTIHAAPTVLTVHLKRFTPMGRKLQHPIRYDERLNLQPVMSDGRHGPTYTLYGVISHMGSGPNHGHYFAHVCGADGRWYEMNDEMVEPSPPPLNMKNAYMLFYIREKGQALAAAVHGTGLVNGMSLKRRKDVSDDEEEESDDDRKADKTARPLPGPDPYRRHYFLKKEDSDDDGKADTGVRPLPPADFFRPHSDFLKRKIEAAEKQKQQEKNPPAQRIRQPAKPLVEYGDESDEDEERGERVERPAHAPEPQMTQNNATGMMKEEGLGSARDRSISNEVSSPPIPAAGSTVRGDGDEALDERTVDEASSPFHPPPPTSPLPTSPPAEAVSPVSFYGPPTSVKRKSPKLENESSKKPKGDTTPDAPCVKSDVSAFSTAKPKMNFSTTGGNPFDKSRIGDNLRSERDEERELFRPRKIHKKQFGSRTKFSY